MATLHLICGLPGSGKTTLARALERETGALRLAPDEWLRRLGADGYDEAARSAMEDLQWLLAQALLPRGVDVILENGFWTREERDRYRARAAELGARVVLHVRDVAHDELVRRITARNAALPESALPDSAFHVNPADLEGWNALFERPGPEELDP